MTNASGPALDRTRAGAAMTAARLDALVAQSPELVYYATGYRPWVPNLYRRAGYGGAVLPADPTSPAGAAVADVEVTHFRRAVGRQVPLVRQFPFWAAFCEVNPTWAARDPSAALDDSSRGKASQLPGQVDRHAATIELIALLHEMGLDRPGTRIGLEWAFTGEDVLGWLRNDLPGVVWQDGTTIFAELRMIKAPQEIAALRAATALAEAGIREAITDLRAGMTAREIVHRYQRAVLCDPAVDGPDGGLDVGAQRLSLRAGPNVLSAEAYGPHRLEQGDVLFLDAGVEVSGYRSDMGRTAIFAAPPTDAQRRVYEALLHGQETIRPLLQPGAPTAELFWAGQRAVWDRGLRAYVRGNLGHGIGLDPQPELPIISSEDPYALAPGMVVSVELPYYVHGLGAFQIEDTYLITASGAERWTLLPDTLLAC